jgi:CubicO group peptidase (beta-lactamase class C family)
MTGLREVLEQHVGEGRAPGAVALVARADEVEIEAVGLADRERAVPMSGDSIFRIASMTKPIAAAGVMLLVDDGLVALDDPIGNWLPELAAPTVVRTPASLTDDVVATARPITVEDLLTFRAGWGFPSDFSLPAVAPLLGMVAKYLREPGSAPPVDRWLTDLAAIPMLSQPGETWLYNTCSDIQGALIARLTGRTLPQFLAERVFEPLGMADTAFEVPDAKLGRFTSSYEYGQDGSVVHVDSPDGAWNHLPVFASGAGGLLSTAPDWLSFGRMLLAGGVAGGRRILSEESVRLMTTDHLTPAQRDASSLFLEGQGWGFGGSVDVTEIDPWNAHGRYGWVGGSGTSGHISPETGMVAVLLTQLSMTGPTPTPLMRDFWAYAARG